MRDAASSQRSLIANFTVLASGHAAGLIVPLLMVPYLARVLRPEGWAPVLIAQALASWMILLLDYGFDLSATRSVAQSRENPDEIRRIAWGVQCAKLLLVPVALFLLVTAYLLLPALEQSRRLAFWTCAFALLRGMNPLWFFQGLEQYRSAVAIDAACKVAGAAAVLMVVRGAADGWMVLALQAIFAAISLIWLTARLRARVPSTWSLMEGIGALRASWALFAFRASGTLYLQANTIILGVFASPVAVASYGGAERIVRAAINLLEPFNRLFLPRISFLSTSNPAQAAMLVQKSLLVLGAASVVGGAMIAIAAPLLVTVLLGAGYENAVPILRWLALLLPTITVGTVLGNFWALPFKRDHALLSATMAAGALNLVLAYLLVPRMAALGMAAAVVCAELLVALSLAALYWKWRSETQLKTVAVV